MLEAYLVGAAWTAVALFRLNRPAYAVQWVPLVGFAALWPLFWPVVIVGAVTRHSPD